MNSLFGRHPDELLSASLTEELSRDDWKRLNLHLARCERCRQARAAFTDQRRLLSGMRYLPPPRDLADRVSRGVAAGGDETPAWRRPMTIVAAVGGISVAAAVVVLAVLLTREPLEPPVAATPDQTDRPVATATFTAGPSASPEPTPSPVLAAGETGYLSLTGTNVDQALILRRAATDGADAAVAELRPNAGPPVAATLSPDGQWLAYQIFSWGKGTNHAWLVRLADGHAIDLGETPGDPFGEQMAWFGASRTLLAYTGLGAEPEFATDVWVVDTATEARVNVTNNGAAYVGSFIPNTDLLWLSVAGSSPNSFLTDLTPTDAGVAPADLSRLSPVSGVFQPIISPSGDRVIFWRGAMTGDGPFRWFESGGTLSVEETAAGRFTWNGEPIFDQLLSNDTVNDPNLLTSASLSWAPDGDTFAVWRVQWQGISQPAPANTFPHPAQLYVGRVSTGEMISRQSFSYGDRFAEVPGTQIVDIEFATDQTGAPVALLVTVQLDAGSEGDANAPVPTATLIRVSLVDGGEESLDGPPGWNGPAIHVEDLTAAD